MGHGNAWLRAVTGRDPSERGKRAALASAGGPAGVPKGKRRDTKRRRPRRKKR